ncbi:zinc ribbon domain-containing protein [Alkalihalobacillus sp. NPDC078783]
MSTSWKEKMEEGLSKVQGGIDQGKQKIQTTQETMKIKREIQEQSRLKAEALLKLGQLTYKKLRAGSIQDRELLDASAEIVEQDTFIYQKNKELSLLNEQAKDGAVCESCQKVNDANAAFCGGCGAEMKKQDQPEATTVTPCPTCKTDMPEGANFCPCCGTATTNSTTI